MPCKLVSSSPSWLTITENISKQKNAQKGGAGSLSLSGHDFMPYVLDEKGLPLAAKAKMATGKKVSDVLKIISVGLRGSDKKRLYSKEKALVLYAGNPQPNEAPHSWTPPDPNVKLLIQRDFPSAGRFRYTVKASNSLSKKINTHFIDSTWDARGQRPRMDKIALQFAPLASWEYGKLEHSKKAIVIPEILSVFKVSKNVKWKGKAAFIIKGSVLLKIFGKDSVKTIKYYKNSKKMPSFATASKKSRIKVSLSSVIKINTKCKEISYKIKKQIF